MLMLFTYFNTLILTSLPDSTQMSQPLCNSSLMAQIGRPGRKHGSPLLPARLSSPHLVSAFLEGPLGEGG